MVFGRYSATAERAACFSLTPSTCQVISRSRANRTFFVGRVTYWIFPTNVGKSRATASRARAGRTNCIFPHGAGSAVGRINILAIVCVQSLTCRYSARMALVVGNVLRVNGNFDSVTGRSLSKFGLQINLDFSTGSTSPYNHDCPQGSGAGHGQNRGLRFSNPGSESTSWSE
jgi:hypothetical protein